ncbi:GNAT family N-acetyltransferase [Vibrio mimicus]|uniref:GNAT family N-acetyltransferase n=2 Tax=Vibrio TaxID=662 RepID=UPI0001BACA40|nr:GNAT family N-acetyltransferase [Vibrio mimicus]EEY37003.1 acetyltransferase gnat family [Vibrio mimicus MB451]TXX97342.1 GNAT family N-acetyltransferase [Vibrio mimicus]
MELQQLNQRQLKCLLDKVGLDSELAFCEGAVPPKHVLIRSYEQIQNSKSEIWSLPYMMLVGNNVVGFCSFKDEPQNGEVEIGYNVSPHKQGRGFAKLAVNQLCQLAFNAGSIERVVALISSTNHASLNVVRANNFAFMGFVVDSDNEELEKWVLKWASCA